MPDPQVYGRRCGMGYAAGGACPAPTARRKIHVGNTANGLRDAYMRPLQTARLRCTVGAAYMPPVAVSRYREHFTPNLSSMTFLITSTQLSSPIAALSKQRS